MSNFKENIIKTFYKTKFACKKHEPEICLISGLVGVVGATVLACFETTKMSKIIENTRNDIKEIKDFRENEANEGKEDEYTEEDMAHDIKVTYAHMALDTVKTYAPAVVLEALSFALIIKSHKLMSKRLIAVTAAYTSLSEAFKAYRRNVINKYGEEEDKAFRFNKKVVHDVTVDENGNEKVTTKTTYELDPNDHSRFFQEGNPNWKNNDNFNRMFLNAQLSWANNMLRLRGYLFYNEVCEALGIPGTQDGFMIGWLRDGDGDGYVSFGIDNLDKIVANFDDSIQRQRAEAILLDFNYDGVILGKVDYSQNGYLA